MIAAARPSIAKVSTLASLISADRLDARDDRVDRVGDGVFEIAHPDAFTVPPSRPPAGYPRPDGGAHATGSPPDEARARG
jgi:hypothetical protein